MGNFLVAVRALKEVPFWRLHLGPQNARLVSPAIFYAISPPCCSRLVEEQQSEAAAANCDLLLSCLPQVGLCGQLPRMLLHATPASAYLRVQLNSRCG